MNKPTDISPLVKDVTQRVVDVISDFLLENQKTDKDPIGEHLEAYEAVETALSSYLLIHMCYMAVVK